MKIKNLFESDNTDYSQFEKLIQTKYSQAFKNLKNGCPIFKGSMGFFDDTFREMTPLKNRKSVNTLNYYTLWMNNSPEWSKFPKRSVICTNSYDYASGYGKVFFILPENNSDIGIVPKDDIWNAFRPMPAHDDEDELQDASVINRSIIHRVLVAGINFKKLKFQINTFHDLLEAIKLFDSLDTSDKESILKGLKKEYFGGYDTDFNYILKHGLYDYLNTVFSPKDFILENINNYNLKAASSGVEHREVWFDNNFLLVNIAYLNKYLEK